MGDYTECILGCMLKSTTPKDVIETLNYMMADSRFKQKEWPNSNYPQGDRSSWMFRSGGSYYFGADSGNSSIREDYQGGWRINTRFNIKNYTGEIENFLKWLEPYVEQGSGEDNFYAIVTFEQGKPVFYNKPKENEFKRE